MLTFHCNRLRGVGAGPDEGEALDGVEEAWRHHWQAWNLSKAYSRGQDHEHFFEHCSCITKLKY